MTSVRTKTNSGEGDVSQSISANSVTLVDKFVSEMLDENVQLVLCTWRKIKYKMKFTFEENCHRN